MKQAYVLSMMQWFLQLKSYMKGSVKVENVCVEKDAKRGQKIDFLGYQFTNDVTLMRKRIKKTFARKSKRIVNEKRRHEVLASYWGWNKWCNGRHLWKVLTNNDMSFAERGIKSQTKTKDGKRFFDDPDKRMMEILNTPITIIDFETGVKTRNGGDRYAIRFRMMEFGEEKQYKVITNSFTLKNVLDQARAYDNRLEALKSKVIEAREKHGENFKLSLLGLTDEEITIIKTNKPMFPQHTCIHRRELGAGKYDFYFD